MPRATADIHDTKRFELTSCPGGFVELRRLNYGEYQQRNAMALKMRVLQQEGKKNQSVEIDNAAADVAFFEFSKCIVDHNLTDENDAPLDFRQRFTMAILDTRVGNEIGEHIDSMHALETEEVGN